MSNNVAETYQRARAHHKAGRLAEAEVDYQRVIQSAGRHAPSLQFLGLIAHQQSDHERAVSLIAEAIELDRPRPLYYNNYGIALQALGRTDEAEQAYRKALELKHDYAGAMYNLGMLLLEKETFDEAETLVREAIDLKPDFAEALVGLGDVLAAQGRIDEADEVLSRASGATNQSPDAMAHRAGLKLRFGRIDEAIELLRSALKIDKNHELSLMYLGNALRSVGAAKMARSCFRRLVKLKPNASQAWINLASIEDEENRYDNALAAFRYAVQVNPDLKAKVACHLALMFLKACDWERYADREKHLISYVREHLSRGNFEDLAPLSLNYFGVPAELRRQAAAQRADVAEKSVEVSVKRCGFVHDRTPVDRLRVGYVSPDFRSHAVGTLIRDLFRHHDRARIEVYGYGLVPSHDDVAKHITRGVDRFHDLSTSSPEAAARKIYEDGIHILIDLAGYTTHSKTEMFALRPAPVQAHYLGYLDTMGADFLPYMFADELVVTPEMEASFSESIIYLPIPFFVTSRMADSGATFSRSDFGLPDDQFVFCCMNNQRKVSPEVFDVWMRILRSVPGSVLWLYERDNVGARTNLRSAAAERDVDPDRIVFADAVPHGDYIARYALADLFLDTFVYNAGATAVGALQSGVPVLTRPGQTILNRMGSSLVLGAGLPELVASDTDDYVSKAVELAQNPSKLARMRTHLLENRGDVDLFDTARWVRNFETGLELMWQDFVTGRGPRSHRIADSRQPHQNTDTPDTTGHRTPDTGH